MQNTIFEIISEYHVVIIPHSLLPLSTSLFLVRGAMASGKSLDLGITGLAKARDHIFRRDSRGKMPSNQPGQPFPLLSLSPFSMSFGSWMRRLERQGAIWSTQAVSLS